MNVTLSYSRMAEQGFFFTFCGKKAGWLSRDFFFVLIINTGSVGGAEENTKGSV